MRGKANFQLVCSVCLRITPAYAGKSVPAKCRATFYRDHPRICGEKSTKDGNSAEVIGSPPHMRGKVQMNSRSFKSNRITPAYAGKRKLWNPSRAACEDHPRICGEKFPTLRKTAAWQGSPPHMRGKDIENSFDFFQNRITPAYAGKSSTQDGERGCT